MASVKNTTVKLAVKFTQLLKATSYAPAMYFNVSLVLLFFFRKTLLKRKQRNNRNSRVEDEAEVENENEYK